MIKKNKITNQIHIDQSINIEKKVKNRGLKLKFN